MSYWCEYLAQIDSGKAVTINLLDNKYTFFTKNNNFGQRNINYNQLAIKDILKKNFVKNFEDEINNLGKIESINFSFEPILKYDVSFSNAFKVVKKNNYQHSIDMSLIINLSLSENELFNNIRTNYKTPIKKELSNMTLKIINSENINTERSIYDDWVECYSNAIKKGNKYFSKEAYNSLFLSIVNSEVVIFCAYENNKFLGGNLFSIIRNIPSYSLGVVSYMEDQNNQRYVSHYLIWHSILYFKKKSFLFLEIDTSCFLEKKTKKEESISFFKRGFGVMYYS